MRIFLDANIVFSAVKTDGAVRHLLHLLAAHGHTCVVDAFVLEEARRNLIAKSLAGADAIQTLSHLWVVEKSAAARTAYPEAGLPDKDVPVLAAAVQNHCDFLVTGDRTHFGHLVGHMVYGVTIHSPRSLAEKLFP